MNERPPISAGAGANHLGTLLVQAIDQQQSDWRRGERPLVEDLVASRLELKHADALLELIYSEAVLREERGERASLQEYQQRFPELAEALAIQWQVHGALVAPFHSGNDLSLTVSGSGAAADLVSALRAGHLEAEHLAEAARLQTFFVEAKALAGEMIQRGWLTPFQANLLLQGRGRDLLLGSYVLLERLGEGGMGTVYKARQRGLGRIVAIKVIRKDRVLQPQAVKRFQREIRAAAKLDHPHIVRAFDADEIDGTHLLVMEYVEHGTDLGKIVTRDGPLPIAAACDYMRQAALGLQHAHERGLVHRDIKPQNLLMVSGGVVRGGKPASTHHAPRTTHQIKILDMGLARLDHVEHGGVSSTSLTGEGAIMGTLDYIAPEQALDSHHVDIRADLYSLGCTFYYLLTGQVPFPGGDKVAKLIRQQTEEPEPVELLRPEVAPAVAAIIHKLMAKRREDRFQTPGELAVALEEVGKRGVEVRGQTSGVRRQRAAVIDSKLARQWAKVVTPSAATEALVEPPAALDAPQGKPTSWRWLVGGGAATLVLLILLVWQPWHGDKEPHALSIPATKPMPKIASAKEPAEPAEPAAKKRQAEAEEALKPIAARVAALAPGALADGEALGKDLRDFLIKHSATPAAMKACALLGQVLAKVPSPLDQLDRAKIPAYELEAARRTTGASPPSKQLLAILGDSRLMHWAEVRAVAFSQDGKTLASGSLDGTVKLWDPATGSELRTLKGHTSYVYAVAFSPDGKTLASGSQDGNVTIWDPARGNELHTLKGHTSSVLSVAFSPDGKTLASGSLDGTVKVWDPAAGSVLRTLKGHTDHVYSVAFNPDGKTLASGSLDGTVKFWDPAADGEPRTLKGSSSVFSVAFSPDGKRLAASSDGAVKLWDPVAGNELRTLKGHSGQVWSVAFSQDGKTLASGGYDETVKLWDPATGRELRPLQGHTSQICAVAFSPDGKTLASGSYDSTVKLWDPAAGNELRFVKGHVGRVRSVAIRPDGKTLASGSGDGTVKLWDPAAGRELRPLTGHTGNVRAVAFSPDGNVLASASADRTVKLWDPAASKELYILKGHSGAVGTVVFSPDGKSLASGGNDGVVQLWDVATGKELRTFKGHNNSFVNSIAFSPDGKTLASGSYDGAVKVWDAVAGTELRPLKGHDSYVNSIAFSPDGNTLASACGDQTVKLWDAATRSDLRTLKGHDSSVTSVAFSPDGKTLATAAGDGTVRLWDSVSGAEKLVFRVGPSLGYVQQAAFAPDGRHLVTANGNGTVYIIRLAEGPPHPRGAGKAPSKIEGDEQNNKK